MELCSEVILVSRSCFMFFSGPLGDIVAVPFNDRLYFRAHFIDYLIILQQSIVLSAAGLHPVEVKSDFVAACNCHYNYF